MFLLNFIAKKKKTYNLEYKVGFVGCELNRNQEIVRVSGWFITEEEK